MTEAIIAGFAFAFLLAIAGLFFVIVMKNKRKVESDIEKYQNQQKDFASAERASVIINSVDSVNYLQDSKNSARMRITMILKLNNDEHLVAATWIVEGNYVSLVKPGEAFQVRVGEESTIYPEMSWAKWIDY